MRIFFLLLVYSTFSLSAYSQVAANEAKYIISADKIKAVIAPTMYGVFFEDINMAGDGGVYAELVKNRSFEFKMPLMGWKEVKPEGGEGSVEVLNRAATNPDNSRYIQLSSKTGKGYGLINEGFHGMGIKKGEQYNFSVLAKVPSGKKTELQIDLLNSKGKRSVMLWYRRQQKAGRNIRLVLLLPKLNPKPVLKYL